MTNETQILSILESLYKSIAFMQENFATKHEIKAIRAEMTTKDEMNVIREEMATKEDLKKFATKDDLKQFATKDDLKRFATKNDLKKFATKDDLKAELKSFVTKDYLDHRLERYATKDDFERMNDNIISHIDGFVGMYQRTDTEMVALRSKCYRLESHVQQLAKHTSLTLE